MVTTAMKDQPSFLLCAHAKPPLWKVRSRGAQFGCRARPAVGRPDVLGRAPPGEKKDQGALRPVRERFSRGGKRACVVSRCEHRSHRELTRSQWPVEILSTAPQVV